MGKWLRRLVACGVLGSVYHNATYRYPGAPLSEEDIAGSGAGRGAAHEGVYDVGIVGGGIVGLAVAREVRRRFPEQRVIVFEKEADVALHQSAHNSGVLHAGIYYEPGSAKARLCVRGIDLMYQFCERRGVPVRRCGKLIVASGVREEQKLERLLQRGVANGVEGLQMLRSPEEIRGREPHVSGTAALWSPNTGIVDFVEVARALLRELQQEAQSPQADNPLPNFTLMTRFEVRDMTTAVIARRGATTAADATAAEDGAAAVVALRGVEPGQVGAFRCVLARRVINCAGLHLDIVAAAAGGQCRPQSSSFRGSYYQLKPSARHLLRGTNVYPCPADSGGIPVGVHFTPTIGPTRGDGNVIIGPTSALCTHREGYSALHLDPAYLARVATSATFWRFLLAHPRLAFDQLCTDLSFQRFLADAQRLIPELRAEDLEPSFAGVMTQVFTDDGAPAADFIFEESRPPGPTQRSVFDHLYRSVTGCDPAAAVASGDPPLVLSLRNAPSPAATASLAIAEEVVARAADCFQWPPPPPPLSPSLAALERGGDDVGVAVAYIDEDAPVS